MIHYTPEQARELATKIREGTHIVSRNVVGWTLDSFAEQIDALTAERDALQTDAARLLEAASRLVEHADFRLGGILSADSKSKEIPSRATSQVRARHLASLRDVLIAMKEPK